MNSRDHPHGLSVTPRAIFSSRLASLARSSSIQRTACSFERSPFKRISLTRIMPFHFRGPQPQSFHRRTRRFDRSTASPLHRRRRRKRSKILRLGARIRRRSLAVPQRLIVDGECVLVDDVGDSRVMVLNSTSLESRRNLVTTLRDKSWYPYRMCVDSARRRLYLAECQYRDGGYLSGDVSVFQLKKKRMLKSGTLFIIHPQIFSNHRCGTHRYV